MSDTQGRRGRESTIEPEQSYRGSSLVTPRQEKVLRQLLLVLNEFIKENESEDYSGNEAKKSKELEPVPTAECDKGSVEKAGTRRTTSRPAPEKEYDQKKVADLSTSATQKYHKSLEHFTRLSYQIRASLTALGGGGRAAKALKEMQEALGIIYTSYFQHLTDGSDSVWGEIELCDCAKSLATAHSTVQEAIDSFQELRIYNDSIINGLHEFRLRLQELGITIDIEYGHLMGVSLAGNYIEVSLLDPLATAFEGLLANMENNIEKDVAMIRKTQEFSSQHYLNLTTVATFLSSVTATTLQITSSNAESSLSIILNTMWLTSLVFSTASAVYSLLIMTWRQSPFRQFDNSSTMPLWLIAILRNGPVFTLITAVFAFSIGLCILAFQTAGQQGHIANAVVPTVFAGIHAFLLLLISAWFLWEQWKTKHIAFWTFAKERLLLPRLKRLQDNRDRIFELVASIKSKTAEAYSSIISFKDRLHKSSEPDLDIEKEAESTSQDQTDVVSEVHSPIVQGDNINNQDTQDHPNTEMPEPVPPIEVTPSDPFETDSKVSQESGMNPVQNPSFQPLLQFSHSREYLVSAHDHNVIIYDAASDDPYFPVVQSIKLTDEEGPVKKILWNEGDELMVQTENLIKFWRFTKVEGKESREELGTLKISADPVSVHRVTDDGGSVTIVVFSNMIEFYDVHCNEIKSFDLSTHGIAIVDAVSLGASKLLCLVGPDTGGLGTNRVIVYNMENRSIDGEDTVENADQRMLVVSKNERRALIYGSEDTPALVEIKDSSIDCYQLWNRTPYYQELSPGGTVGFCGKNDELIYGVSGYEVVILRGDTEDTWFKHKALHIFDSPSFPMDINPPISFSIRPDTIPYIFAFGLPNRSIKVWAIQSNNFFEKGGPGVEKISIHDRKGRGKEPRVSGGRCFTIMPPQNHDFEETQQQTSDKTN